MIFFFFFLFASLILGSFTVGPFSIRVYITVVMLLFLITQICIRNKKIYSKMSRGFVLQFIVFIIFAAIGLLMNGDYDYIDFTKLLLANYINCFVLFFAIDYFVTNEKKMESVFVFCSLLIGFDAIVTLLQHFGNPLGQLVTLAFTTSSDYADMINDNAGVNEDKLFGLSLPVGFFGYVHTNAVYLSCFGLLALGLSIKKKSRFSELFFTLILVLSLYSCFCTQERAAFLLFLMFVLYVIWKYSSRGAKMFLLAILAFFLIVLLPTMLLNGALGRFSSFEAGKDTRSLIWSDCFDFLSNNFLLGGPSAFNKINPAGAHNFFFNAFINFGLIAAFIAIYIYFSMIKYSINSFFKSNDYYIKVLAGSVLIYSAICQFHNASIMSGDTLIFLLYPLLLKAQIIRKKRIYNEKNLVLN